MRLGVADLETRLGVERSTIFRWYKAGKFPVPHYIGSKRMWLLAEIERWEQSEVGRPRSWRINPPAAGDP